LRGVSKDGGTGASWFETAQQRLLTMRDQHLTKKSHAHWASVLAVRGPAEPPERLQQFRLHGRIGNSRSVNMRKRRELVRAVAALRQNLDDRHGAHTERVGNQ
jgi:hypothetical protein